MRERQSSVSTGQDERTDVDEERAHRSLVVVDPVRNLLERVGETTDGPATQVTDDAFEDAAQPEHDAVLQVGDAGAEGVECLLGCRAALLIGRPCVLRLGFDEGQRRSNVGLALAQSLDGLCVVVDPLVNLGLRNCNTELLELLALAQQCHGDGLDALRLVGTGELSQGDASLDHGLRDVCGLSAVVAHRDEQVLDAGRQPLEVLDADAAAHRHRVGPLLDGLGHAAKDSLEPALSSLQ